MKGMDHVEDPCTAAKHTCAPSARTLTQAPAHSPLSPPMETRALQAAAIKGLST